MSVLEGPLTIWCLLRDQFAHVKPVEEYMGSTAQFVYDGEWDPEAMLRAQPDVVLCVNEHYSEVTQCLVVAQQHNLPTLCVQDGMLEWRCQYENPLFGEGGGSPQHQPVFADKIACIGRQSARQIERWGNLGKCEVVGMPRLDYLLTRPRQNRAAGGKKRLLVMTAKKAGFTPSQVDITVRSLKDIKTYAATRRDLDLHWRVSRQCEERMGIANRMCQPESTELASVLDDADAVVTTPSTAMLEAMLMGKPVAVLDYHNVPRFVPSAWTISAPVHLPEVLGEILAPPPRNLAYQEDCLHDALECASPAVPRLAQLLEAMAQASRLARSCRLPLSLPPRMVVASGVSVSVVPKIAEFYPNTPVFREQDIVRLQVQLARAQHENTRLRQRLRRQSFAVRAAVAVRQRLRRSFECGVR